MYERFEDYNTKKMFADMHFDYDVGETAIIDELNEEPYLMYTPIGFELKESLRPSQTYAKFIEREIENKLKQFFVIKRKEKKIVANVERIGFVLLLHYVLNEKKIFEEKNKN